MDANDELNDTGLHEELRKVQEERDLLAQRHSVFLSEIAELNAKLIKAEHAKSGFLSNVRNEIINPLTSILGLSGKIMNNDADGALFVKLGTLLHHEAVNLDFQIRNIVAAAEIEAGIVQPIAITTSISDLVNDQVKYFAALSQEKDISIVVKGTPDQFITDPCLLKLIVSNLVSNAIKFSQPYQVVTVSLSSENGAIALTVADNGPGISDRELKNVFNRFSQGNQGSTKTHHGHGLGLSVVKEFTDILRGKLQVKSNPGLTEITITLPELSPDLLEEGFLSSADDTLFSDDVAL